MMIPGRILIVDDKKGEVDDLISEFQTRGEHVIYSNLPVESGYYDNVRLLIIDYWLDEDSEEHSLQDITTILNDIAEKSKFFMIVVWSVRVTDENREQCQRNIVEAYKRDFERDMPGILLEPIGKDELDYENLIEKIEEEIAKHPDLNLIYEIEKIVDQAKDSVKTIIYDIGNWSNLIKSLRKEFDRDSIMRQVLHIYLNILKRNVESSDRLGECIDKVIELNEAFCGHDFGRVYSAQYYYLPSEDEQISTGDIIWNEESDKYYMVITPECDITHDKHTATKLVEAMRIDHSALKNPEKLEEITESLNLKSGGALNAVVRGEGGLRANYCSLAFLTDYETNEFFHLIFDFNKVEFVGKARKMSGLSGYSRISRVDSPLINSFIQRYVSHCSRFGTISIPKEVLDELKKEPSEQNEAAKGA